MNSIDKKTEDLIQTVFDIIKKHHHYWDAACEIVEYFEKRNENAIINAMPNAPDKYAASASPANTSEIPVIDSIKRLIRAELQMAHTENDYSYEEGAIHLVAVLSPYLRTTEPVVVDLKAAASAIEACACIAVRNGNKAVVYNGESVAKACANIWGLSYAK